MGDVPSISKSPRPLTAPDASGATQPPGVAPPPPVAPAAPADGFRTPAPPPASAGQLAEAALPQRSPSQLLPDLSQLKELAEVPARFAADVALLKAQLLGGAPGGEGPGPQRLFEFFAAYAGRFVELAGQGAAVPEKARLPAHPAISFVDGESPAGKLPSEPRAAGIARFTEALANLGFRQLRDARSGHDGLQVSRELLATATLAELRAKAGHVELIAAASDPARAAPLPESRASSSADARDLGAGAVAPSVEGRPLVLVSPPRQESARELEAPTFAERLATSSRRLGPQALWNALHTFRTEPENSVQRKDAWNRLILASILILAGVLALVVVLVNL